IGQLSEVALSSRHPSVQASDVESAERFGRLPERVTDLIRIGHVGVNERRTDGRRSILPRRVVDVDDDAVRAFADEPARRREADARRSAGNECLAPFEQTPSGVSGVAIASHPELVAPPHLTCWSYPVVTNDPTTRCRSVALCFGDHSSLDLPRETCCPCHSRRGNRR